jgi:hypothetical protein
MTKSDLCFAITATTGLCNIVHFLSNQEKCMTAQFRFLSRMVCLLAFGLMALMWGAKAHAQSVAITSYNVTGSPGEYYNVTDTVSVAATFSNIPSSGGYGCNINANVYYYSGPYASGTLLQSTTKTLYGTGAPLAVGNTNVSVNVNLDTPNILRASKPVGTQSILYVYSVQVGGGCNGWSGTAMAGGPNAFVVHG